ncbi:MAG: UDP-N-acetylglucosamine--N-acetylmuramyl-(pentapeptide) pyrophosphoryl-undecaprenol N-acetylglucosamine transferase, partial [Gemmatimonadetes bacterium]|nr:UDP-N-acetylglucosamine--N-acetylmuramyl-(pentapeptide) pyrophosphoryl-undecaprenol N-acetylglucosamine transferase [Gemmatimonadota bacterium]
MARQRRDERRGPVAVFSGGGTGGHLYPALALAEALGRIRPDVDTIFVGAERGIEARVLPARGVEHLLVPVRSFSRESLVRNAGVVVDLLRALIRVVSELRRIRPGVVVVTGGYAGGPAGIAAALLGIPLALQEQNAFPGMTTRVLSRWARQIHVAFPEAISLLPRRAQARAQASGNPIREPGRIEAGEARARFGLSSEGSVVLVVGGSQGSEALNRLVAGAVAAATSGEAPRPSGLQMLWATGPGHLESVEGELAGTGAEEWVRTVGYIDDMPAALSASTLSVSRAGASTTSEFLAWGLPAILIPLPTAAADHQTRNARALEEGGVA